MHKTILFLFAFLITPITASYAVIDNTEIIVKPGYDGSGSISGGGISDGIGDIGDIGGTTVPGTTTPCADRPCSVTTEETNNKISDFAKCVWVTKPEYPLLVFGASTDNQCKKKWFCKNAGYYAQIKSKVVNNGKLFSLQYFVSCEPCPSACRNDDTDCINNDNKNTTTQTPTQITGQIDTYSAAQSVNDCYLRMQHTSAPNEITGSDEIGNFRTIKTDNSFICPY